MKREAKNYVEEDDVEGVELQFLEVAGIEKAVRLAQDRDRLFTASLFSRRHQRARREAVNSLGQRRLKIPCSGLCATLHIEGG